MNTSDPNFSLALISKVASAKSISLSKDDAPAIITGFIEYLQKEAGCSEGEALGTILWFAELGGMPKTAAPDTVVVAPTPAPASAPESDPIEFKDSPWGKKFIAEADRRQAQISAGMEGAVTKALDPKVVISKSLEGYPQIQGVANKIMGGDFGGGMSDAYKGLASNPTVRSLAPYALAGIGSYLASRAMGADKSTAALTGLAGGALLGYGYNNRDQLIPAVRAKPVPPNVDDRDAAAAAAAAAATETAIADAKSSASVEAAREQTREANRVDPPSRK